MPSFARVLGARGGVGDEADGVAAFAKSYEELLETVASKMHTAT